ncbi:MAG TPA: adenine-specific methyltransferase EcoRI family protein [Candidatus Nanopelagicales bacterium]|nr:adenine-specific methyltransferase EcoRI family protein [Candidatus Nanopelagicales bacterium]
MAKNSNLTAAREARRDEFYSEWSAVEREMNAYLEFNPDVFRGKTILLPCDDPEWSNFTKYFALHLASLGIKKLISTSYAPDSNASGEFYTPTLFDDPQFDEDLDRARGKIFTLTPDDVSGDGRIDIDDLRWEYLEGDGDFRSAEVTALRDEADMVITNPPFSLLVPFILWLVEGEVEFSIIGPKNAATYKEVFPLIMGEKMWLGRGFANGNAYFRIPDSARTDYADGVYDPETQLVHFRNVTWFTNIDHGRRHEPLQLMTKSDNVKFSRHKAIRGVGYVEYDNYDALEVPFVDAIPSDHEGLMGVPITFLDRFSPAQFELIGSYNNGVHGEELGAEKVEVLVSGRPTMWNGPVIDGKPVYKRIVIRHRNPEPKKG